VKLTSLVDLKLVGTNVTRKRPSKIAATKIAATKIAAMPKRRRQRISTGKRVSLNDIE